MENNQAQTSSEAPDVILAYGQAPRHLLIKIVIGVFGVLLLGLFGFLSWTLQAKIPLPQNISFLAITNPRQSEPLAPLFKKEELPPLWQTALNQKTFWPAFLGFWTDAAGTHFFTIQPRWVLSPHGSQAQNRVFGPWKVISETEFEATPQTKTIFQLLKLRFLHPFADAVLQLPVNTNPNETLVAWSKKNFVFTDLTSQKDFFQEPLAFYGYDMGFALDPSASSALSLLDVLSRGSTVGSELPVMPSQLHLALDKNNTPSIPLAHFSSPLSDAEIKKTAASLGLYEKKILQLPDGTIGLSTLLRSVDTAEVIKNLKDEKGFEISDSKKDIMFSTSTEEKIPKECDKTGNLVAYFSPKAINLTLRLAKLHLKTDGFWYFFIKNQRLVLCVD